MKFYLVFDTKYDKLIYINKNIRKQFSLHISTYDSYEQKNKIASTTQKTIIHNRRYLQNSQTGMENDMTVK